MTLRFAFLCPILGIMCIPLCIFSKQGSNKNGSGCNEKMMGDTIAPVPYCLTGIITVPLPYTKCITFYAKDLDKGSFDNVTPQSKLKFYFDGDSSQVSKTICCEDFIKAGATNELKLNVQMWVEDEAGNKDYCPASIVIQDNQNVCPSDPGLPSTRVSGAIKKRLGDEVTATIDLIKDNKLQKEIFGNMYLFGDLSEGTYSVCPYLNDDASNGISTADIVKIQRHILGINTLSSPYLLLAADVNNSKTITAADITEIRKLILGVIPKFSKVDSWIFVSNDTSYHILTNPIYNTDYCKSFEIKMNQADTLDFIAIKMGDVTENARGNHLNEILTRNQTSLLTYYSEYSANHLIITTFSLAHESDLSGLQFTLAFNSSEIEFLKITNGTINIEEEQYSLLDIEKGKIHFAWDSDPLENYKTASTNLFSILWRKKTNKAIQPILTFDPTGVKPLLIDHELNDVDLILLNTNSNHDPEIEVITDLIHKTIYLQANTDHDMNIECSLMNLNGKILFQKNIVLHAGINIQNLNFQNLPANGLYFLKLHNGSFTSTSKLLFF